MKNSALEHYQDKEQLQRTLTRVQQISDVLGDDWMKRVRRASVSDAAKNAQRPAALLRTESVLSVPAAALAQQRVSHRAITLSGLPIIGVWLLIVCALAQSCLPFVGVDADCRSLAEEEREHVTYARMLLGMRRRERERERETAASPVTLSAGLPTSFSWIQDGVILPNTLPARLLVFTQIAVDLFNAVVVPYHVGWSEDILV